MILFDVVPVPLKLYKTLPNMHQGKAIPVLILIFILVFTDSTSTLHVKTFALNIRCHISINLL